MDIGPGAIVLAAVVIGVLVWLWRRPRGNVRTVEPAVVDGHEASPFAGLAPEAQRAIAEKWIGCVVQFRVRHADGFMVIDGRRVVVERVGLIYGHRGFGVLVSPDAETGEIMIPLEMIMGVKG